MRELSSKDRKKYAGILSRLPRQVKRLPADEYFFGDASLRCFNKVKVKACFVPTARIIANIIFLPSGCPYGTKPQRDSTGFEHL
jgi:hypothetical protein